MFPDSRGFVALPVTSCIKDTLSNFSLSNNLVTRDEIVQPCDRHSKVTVILRKSMLLNINICENGWSNFSGNLRIVAFKFLTLTRFLSPNLSIYFNFVRCWRIVVMFDILKPTARAWSINKEIYTSCYNS